MPLDSVRVDNRLDEMPMVPVGVPQLRRAGAGPQEQLEPDQCAVERRRDGTVRRAAPKRRRFRRRAAEVVFLMCSALSESILDAVRHGDVCIVDEFVGGAP